MKIAEETTPGCCTFSGAVNQLAPRRKREGEGALPHIQIVAGLAFRARIECRGNIVVNSAAASHLPFALSVFKTDCCVVKHVFCLSSGNHLRT